MPMSGLMTGKFNPMFSDTMFLSVCDATWPRESPMTMASAPSILASSLAVRCMTRLHMTHW